MGNVLAAGGCEIARGGRRERLSNPRIVGLAEAEAYLPTPLRPLFRLADWPGYLLADVPT